ncbi:LytR/AlgR family response regulator transcription factor [Roseateles sp. BYS180W]|uniref:LytR/AlgR family response regulator transcription factor n=1 Tax=Roseateles rivi TaxID=3299028 RepID=A0ABW7FTD2_9BURK
MTSPNTDARWRTLIADDEEAPREQLRAALQRVAPQLPIVAASIHGVDAWDDCLALEPELCFLDIRMPGLNGLEVAQRMAALERPPLVVFVSAYGDHALSAFEAGAVDYLMKPVDDTRLAQCLQRQTQRRSAASDNTAQLQALLQQLAPRLAPRAAPLIQASVGKEVHLIAPEDVIFFQSDQRYTRVVHSGGEAWIRTPLKELLVQLDAQQFWQVHRSVVVNSRCIASALRQDENTMLLTLRGHAERLPVSRQFQGLFKGW